MFRWIVPVVLAMGSPCALSQSVVVASKSFTEGYLLGELAAQVLESSQPPILVQRKLGLGNTGILIQALRNGSIDVYADYTGTIAEAILKNPSLRDTQEIRDALWPLGLTISDGLGFNNTYALAVRESFAAAHGLQSISDLARLRAPVRMALSYEFMERTDGFHGMVERYHLNIPPQNVQRMEHSLVYQALAHDGADLIEVYSTDANIKKYQLRVLRDDLSYFPNYQAVWVARRSFSEGQPRAWARLLEWQGRLNETTMLDLNARADLDKMSFAGVVGEQLHLQRSVEPSWIKTLRQRTIEHLGLVGVALLFSIVVGVPLGVFAARWPVMGQFILLVSALVQTIPSLALLCFLIPVAGIGTKPALIALCLYSLLPVVLNTFTGIREVNFKHVENARAFGLNEWQILWRVVLPLSSPTILAGLKTATIVSIGTATLAALVGAGGYGASIVTGLALNDIPTILTGAGPAALMALCAHGLFLVIERLAIPRGLRS